VDWNRRSLYSVIIYLNSCAGGGRTRLLVLSPGQAYSLDDAGRFRAPDDAIVDSAPVKAGSALLFYQTVVHEGEPVGAGCEKFIIRTDLMFERTVGDDDDDDDGIIESPCLGKRTHSDSIMMTPWWTPKQRCMRRCFPSAWHP
jgi:hypothetical protein